MERYLDQAVVDGYRLKDIPRLMRHAWNMALLDPEYGDEFFEDACSDVDAIVSREGARLTQQANEKAMAQAADWTGERLERREQIARSDLASFVTAAPGGFNPHGWWVYLLWPSKDADAPVYIGRTGSIFERIASHWRGREKLYGTHWITLIQCADERTMERTEERLIRHYQPQFNKHGVGIRR